MMLTPLILAAKQSQVTPLAVLAAASAAAVITSTRAGAQTESVVVHDDVMAGDLRRWHHNQHWAS